jgi:predicted hydrocarbon binding protein
MEPELMGAAISGAYAYIPQREIILRDFTRKAELEEVQDDQFYPLSLYTDMIDFLDEKFKSDIVLENIGKAVGESVIETALEPLNLDSVKSAVDAIQKAHEMFCKPVEGSFKLIEEQDRFLRIRYTAPYNCVLQEGLIFVITRRYGGPGALVRHVECRRRGAAACIYELVW